MEKASVNNLHERTLVWLWAAGFLSMAIFLVAAMLPPISQPVAYHQFADQRNFFGIPNFLNVASNLVLLFCGMAGLLFILRPLEEKKPVAFLKSSERLPYLILFLSVVATCFGSAYYHWAPDNERLLWDRLPIAIGITSLFAATLVDRVSLKAGLILLPWLILIGIGSVLYWYWSEQTGAGNLNFYIVTQFYSLFLIFLLGVFLPSRYTHGSVINWAIGLYGVAKLMETLDREIYQLTGVISGHTLKHLIAALAVYWLLIMLQRRSPVPEIQ